MSYQCFPIAKTFPIHDQKKELDLHKGFCEEKSFKFTIWEENRAEIAIFSILVLATLQHIGRFQ